MTTETPSEVESLLRLLWRRRGLILAVWGAAVAAAAVVTLLMPRTYEAELALLIGRLGRKSERGVVSTPLVERDIVTATLQSPAFLAATLARAGIADPGAIRVSATARSELIGVTARAPEPGLAVRAATALADAIVASHRERYESALSIHEQFEKDLERQIEETQRFVGELSKALADRRGDREVAAQTLFQVRLADAESQLLALKERLRDLRELRSPATSYPTAVTVAPVTPTRPVSPVVWLNLLIGLLFGFVLAVALAYLVEFAPLLRAPSGP
ncbi:MAG TPA: Wzz/FepE/Etk N-terminal domain-containing protein [Methylomirabilota bacterium]|jgi:uncharacterized protein involved in exopolysaccharide biosynthesis|nr:Wzz/FepE/Etk N-terminal domain-containing protein [Methylomirabilota bacterium]